MNLQMSAFAWFLLKLIIVTSFCGCSGRQADCRHPINMKVLPYQRDSMTSFLKLQDCIRLPAKLHDLSCSQFGKSMFQFKTESNLTQANRWLIHPWTMVLKLTSLKNLMKILATSMYIDIYLFSRTIVLQNIKVRYLISLGKIGLQESKALHVSGKNTSVVKRFDERTMTVVLCNTVWWCLLFGVSFLTA